jgi:hypothetical protein
MLLVWNGPRLVLCIWASLLLTMGSWVMVSKWPPQKLNTLLLTSVHLTVLKSSPLLVSCTTLRGMTMASLSKTGRELQNGVGVPWQILVLNMLNVECPAGWGQVCFTVDWIGWPPNVIWHSLNFVKITVFVTFLGFW